MSMVGPSSAVPGLIRFRAFAVSAAGGSGVPISSRDMLNGRPDFRASSQVCRQPRLQQYSWFA